MRKPTKGYVPALEYVPNYIDYYPTFEPIAIIDETDDGCGVADYDDVRDNWWGIFEQLAAESNPRLMKRKPGRGSRS